ncbi:MAG: hypothetical protein KH353_04550 [Clostridium sp.]|nr:hypothetical protein [Clostridium sp.]
MGFKEIIARDNRSVFLNPAEFGSLHRIDGRILCILVDDNEMIEREKRTPSGDELDGIYKRKLLFYALAKEFGPLPAIGRLLTLDDRKYRIIDAVNEDGIYSISLEAVRGV